MSDPMPCTHCGATTCPEYNLSALADLLGESNPCCASCSGNHETDTYHRYYPETTQETR